MLSAHGKFIKGCPAKRNMDPTWFHCRANVGDVGPIVKQQCSNMHCLLVDDLSKPHVGFKLANAWSTSPAFREYLANVAPMSDLR